MIRRGLFWWIVLGSFGITLFYVGLWHAYVTTAPEARANRECQRIHQAAFYRLAPREAEVQHE